MVASASMGARPMSASHEDKRAAQAEGAMRSIRYCRASSSQSGACSKSHINGAVLRNPIAAIRNLGSFCAFTLVRLPIRKERFAAIALAGIGFATRLSCARVCQVVDLRKRAVSFHVRVNMKEQKPASVVASAATATAAMAATTAAATTTVRGGAR